MEILPEHFFNDFTAKYLSFKEIRLKIVLAKVKSKSANQKK
jgi:hypothetical protein